MRALRNLRVAASSALVVVLLPVLASCSSDDDDPVGASDPLVGTWTATSFQAFGQDFIADGMALSITVNANDTYAISVTNDLIGVCDPQTSCTETGTYSSSATQITLDPGPDATTLNYSIQGNTMTLTGSIDAVPVTIVLTRA
ncbi:MAG TPA: lipocalin family protein [Gemmatimonadaceae bacterium]|nr:lipocalin family protein [Gemmatimonadaceae bacterium]